MASARRPANHVVLRIPFPPRFSRRAAENNISKKSAEFQKHVQFLHLPEPGSTALLARGLRIFGEASAVVGLG